MGIIRFFGVTLTLMIGLSGLNGCAQGHCRRKVDTPEVVAPVASAPDLGPKSSQQDRVFVYKYDGSLQCGQGKGLSVETMAKELTGISIRSMSKKPDGLMHIQVCGSTTGTANVYEIAASALKKAENKGFKKWSFEQ